MKLTVNGSGRPTATDNGWAELFDEDEAWKLQREIGLKLGYLNVSSANEHVFIRSYLSNRSEILYFRIVIRLNNKLRNTRFGLPFNPSDSRDQSIGQKPARPNTVPGLNIKQAALTSGACF